MSRNNRDYKWDRERGNRDRNDRDQDYYRSREKNNETWARANYEDNNQRSHSGNNYRRNNNWHDNRHNNRYQNRNHNFNQGEKIVRQIFNVQVASPEQFIINQNPQFTTKEKKFSINIKKSNEPPIKNYSKVDELKNKITPIQKIWTSTIKQYLNDSEFVEIYRKGKSLAFGNVEYGKSIIAYDEGDKFMHYENQTSQSKIFSRAYFKIWQILDMGIFNDKKQTPIKIASVAEGPGGFLHALIDYRLKHSPDLKDKYYSITLRITENTRNAKDWSDFRSKTYFDQMRQIGYKIRLSYGRTDTGDLLKQENINYFAQRDLENQKCYLVTGDGGIECIGDKEFDYQEVFNVKLFLGEIITALKVQEIGGKFILKIYDSCFLLTKQLIALLCVFYRKVRIVKPVTSRPGNSEKYLLCEDFLGITPEQQHQLKQLLNQWTEIQKNLSYFQNKEYVTQILDFKNFGSYGKILQNLQKSNNHFLEQQIEKLEQGLKLTEQNNNNVREIQKILKETRWKQQMGYAYGWCQKYGIKSIDVKVVQPGQATMENQKKEEKAEEDADGGVSLNFMLL